jgi:hypothetical protein
MKTIDKLSTYDINSALKQQIVRYIDKGIAPASKVLVAVICNDLREAVLLSANKSEELDDLVVFFVVHAPSNCWGTKRKFINWQKDGVIYT